MRGFFAIGVYRPKNEINIGSLYRTAYLMRAAYIFTIAGRYKTQASDTFKTSRHIPLIQYDTMESFMLVRPEGARLVGIELTKEARLLDNYVHPQQAIYLLGAEDSGLPQNILDQCNDVVKLRGDRSMNVSIAGSIVMYHRGIDGVIGK